MCNFKMYTYIYRKSLALLLKSSAALTMNCYQEFAIKKQVPEPLTS